MRLKVWCFLCFLFVNVKGIPVSLLYDYNVPEAIHLPKEDDVSSPEIKLKEPVVFYGIPFESIYFRSVPVPKPDLFQIPVPVPNSDSDLKTKRKSDVPKVCLTRDFSSKQSGEHDLYHLIGHSNRQMHKKQINPGKVVSVNSNGFLSFSTEIPQFINIQFPLDYPIIAPFYSNVDIRRAGSVSYYETENPILLERATENVHEAFINSADFQATSLFIVTWQGVGYFREREDKLNTYQIVLTTDGVESYVEFLYPENGIQWIQGTGDESGLPDARAQAGLISPEGKVFTLPGSGTEQVRNLESWSNIGLEGQFIYKVDGVDVVEPDADFATKSSGSPLSCAEAPTYCHVQAKCIDYEEGFCCECDPKYYGNGRSCVKKDVPLRVNGKINGKINGELLEGLDLQSYIVMTDGRTYTAISKIPESVGFDIQSLQILGGVIGYLFAKPVRNALNGYQLTGGVFNHTATITFLNTSQTIQIKQKFLGLDVFDQLRLEADIQGEIPNLPDDSKIVIDEYQEQYTLTNPGVLQMTSHRIFKYSGINGQEITHHYKVDQTYLFDYCKYENKTAGETWKLKVGKNFISYESREQIIRFGLSNKITPIGDFDPCEEGRSQCTQNSACVVENESFRCVCNPGYQYFYTGSETICADINECQTGQHECDYNAQCINIVGSYTCQCYPGFEGNGRICENARSCQNITCGENAECVENNEVAMCKCVAGFTGDGQSCRPKSGHSCHEANNCSPFGYCTISPETNDYYCVCLPGYAGDGYTCVQVETTTSIVQELTTTTITPDTCDVLNNCHRDASCLYSDIVRAYACVCNEGFEGDGYNCEAEFISCTKLDNCDPHATCTYDETLGKSKCICNPGFEGDGYNCSITAICTSNQDCPPTEECAYTSANRYECICKEGYVRDSQHQCVIITGSCGGGTCAENAECLFDEDYQTFYCACKRDYVGDGITECREKIVGCDTLNNCGVHASCQYNADIYTYKCVCNEGFFGDGFNCYAERNCHIDPGMCDPHAACHTDAERNYICQCNTGYIGNGTVCREISRYEGNFLLVNQGMATLKIPLTPSKTNMKRPIQIRSYQTAVGLDIDCIDGRVYWSDISGRAIRSALFNGSMKTDFIKDGIGSPEGLAVDWVSRNIYWTDSTQDTIEVANFESKRRRTLFNTDLVNPRGIAVHPQRGKIFWTDWNRKNPKIEWANADGTDRQIFFRGEAVVLPNSLTIDYDTEQLCYADAGTKKIECVHIDTRTKQTIAVNCTYPFGIAVTDKHIYWSDWISKKIEVVDKYTLNRLSPLQVPLGGSGNKLFGLVAVANSCPQLTNVCQYYRNQCPAEHICLPNGLGSRRCLCAYRSDALDEKPSCNL